MLDKALLEIIVCPHCKGPLHYNPQKLKSQHQNESAPSESDGLETEMLICKAERLGYPVRDDIPVLLVDEAIDLAGHSFS